MIAYSVLYKVDPILIEGMKKLASVHSESYDLVAYCPITPDAAVPFDDGYRLVEPELQAKLDSIIKTLIPGFKCPVIRLSENSRNTWQDELVSQINSMGQNKTIGGGVLL